MASSAAALAFCSAASPPFHGRGAGGMGVSSWNPTPIARCCIDDNNQVEVLRRRRRRPLSAWSLARPWLAPPPPLSSSSMNMLGEDEVSRSRARTKAQNRGSQRWRQPFGALLHRARARRAPAGAAARAAQEESKRQTAVAKHLGVLLLPPLGWFPAAVAGVLKRRPAEVAAATAAAAEPAVAAGRSLWGLSRPSALAVLQCLVRSEAVLAGALLVAAPFLLRLWARAEADHHDTLECRSVLQTYLIAGFGWVCAVLAAVAGNPLFAVRLQLAWRVAAARSLWTWSDLGRDLDETPGWLHASVSRWRIAATRFALAGAAVRLPVLIAAAIGRGRAAVLALSSPAPDFLPARLVQVASAPLEEFARSSAQLGLGFSMYAWIGYYAVCFLPYRMLYDEYQSCQRRVAQMMKDMTNGDDYAVELSTKLGPQFPKHLRKRMARMPPGDDREALRLMGIIRERSCSYTVRKVAKRVKKKDGTSAMKMVPLEFGDMSYWGSDLFERLEQQERHDKKTGWKRPQVPGSGPDKYITAEYARILRRIKVELGKTDAEMENDPALSLSNLMQFDPEAEEGGSFDLVMQQESPIDVARENYRMKNSHEMLVRSPSSADSHLGEEAGALSGDEAFGVGGRGEDGTVLSTDSVSYKSGDTSGRALEEAIRSRTSTPENGKAATARMTPAAATRDTHNGRHGQEKTRAK